MARKPQNYWEKRQTKLMKRIEKNTEPTINELISVYREATNNINKEIVRIYNNYGKDSGLSQQALMHLLNSRETKTHYDNLLKVIQNNIKDEDLKKKLLAKYTAPAYNFRISRYQELQEQIDLQLKIAADKELEITRIKYTDTINETYNRNMFDIQKGLGFEFQFNAIDNKTINLMLKEKWVDKGNFSTRIWKNNEKLGEYLKTQLSAASLSGKSVQKISSDLAHYMQVGMSQATTLVRTEMNHFANEAEMMAYQELDIDEYRFIATLDKVTCVHCAKLDKRKFKVSERKIGYNYPPIHPNDRCTTIAVIDDEVKDDLLRRAKDEDGNTIFIPQDMNYNQWKAQYINKTSTNQQNRAKISNKITYKRMNQEEFIELSKKHRKNITEEIRKIIYKSDWDTYGNTELNKFGYINSNYSGAINYYRRTGNNPYGDKYTKQFDKTIDSLKQAISMNKLDENIEVTRYLDLEWFEDKLTKDIYRKARYNQKYDELINELSGKIVPDNQFISTSATEHNNMQTRKVKMLIHTEKGTNAFVTENIMESEIVFDNSKLLIEKIKEDDDKLLVIARIIKE